MFIGAYLCVSAFVFGLGLLALLAFVKGATMARTLRQQLIAYSAVSLTLIGLGLAAFIGFSAMAGLMRFRGAGSWSYPGDYLAAGPVGWIVMLLPLIGILSPLLIVAMIRRRA